MLGLGAHLFPVWYLPGTFWVELELLFVACLTGMMSEETEMRKEATGPGVLKAVSKSSALEETSPPVTPPTSPTSATAWGGQFAPTLVKDVNPEVLRSGVAYLPGEWLSQNVSWKCGL